MALTTEDKKDLAEIFANANKSVENTNVSFSHKSVVTSLLIAGLIGIITAAIAVWSNDKDQDNNIENINSSMLQIQQNQVILGEKFDNFTDEPRYTKKQHDAETTPLQNDINLLKISVEKNTDNILKIKDRQVTLSNKIQIFEIQASK